MRKLFIAIVALIASVSHFAVAQTVIEAQRGETITLTAEGAQNCVWRVSSDNSLYFSLREETKPSLTIKADAPLYYQAYNSAENKPIATYKINLPTMQYLKTWEMQLIRGFCKDANGVVILQNQNPPITIPSGNEVSSMTRYGREGTDIVSDEHLRNWNSKNAHAVFYYFQDAAVYDLGLKLKVDKDRKVAFRLKVFDPNNMDTPIAESYFTLVGTGAEQILDHIISVTVNKSRYYCYDLQCVANPMFINYVDEFIFNANKASVEVYNFRHYGHPAGHLGWGTNDPSAPQGKHYDWIYVENMIDPMYKHSNTYAMSIGFYGGYSGLQYGGSDYTHNMIFSVWDDGDTKYDPNLPQHMRSGPVDAGDRVQVNHFDAEGSGTQTYIRDAKWIEGVYTQYLLNLRPETGSVTVKGSQGQDSTFVQNSLIYSMWYNVQDGKGWQYISSLRIPNYSDLADGWSSFLEPYSVSDDYPRAAYYKNGFARDATSKNWFHFNKLNYTYHTDDDGVVGAEYDIFQGVAPDDEYAYYQRTGGFFDKEIGRTVVPRITENTPIDTINLEPFYARIEQALAAEKERSRRAVRFYNRTGWTVYNANNNNTEGAKIIDNNEETFLFIPAQTEPWFMVDMKKSQPFTGFQLWQSGLDEGKIKDLTISVSDNSVTWKEVYRNSEVKYNAFLYIDLEKTVTARYVKFQIHDTWKSEYWPLYRLHEFNVLMPTQYVESITLSDSEIAIKGPQTVQLSCTITPSNAHYTDVKWYAEDPTIASVSNAGLVKGLSDGSTYIVCQATDGSNISARCKVTVTGRKKQTLTWNQDFNPNLNDAVTLTASASSGLPITYERATETGLKNVTFTTADNVSTAKFGSAGKVKIFAYQAGDDTYAPSDTIYKEFKVLNSTQAANLLLIDGIYYRLNGNSLEVAQGYQLYTGDMVIPETAGGYPVTKIGSYAFSYCDKMSSIFIPASVTSIGNFAFSYSYNYDSITVAATTPPSCQSNSFATKDYARCVVYIPEGTLSDYQSHSVWKKFRLIEKDMSGIESAFDDEPTIVAIYNTNGIELPELQPGINIVRYSNGKVEKIIK